MNTLFVCDIKTGDFLWNEKRIPMPKMEENLTLSGDDGITKQNNNDDNNAFNDNFEAISTQESNNFSGSQPSSQNQNNLSPVQRRLNFNEVAEDYEEKQEEVEETNENTMNIISDNNAAAGEQGEMDPDLVKNSPVQNFGFGYQNVSNVPNVKDIEEKSYEEANNVLNMSLDNVGEPSLRSPLFKSKNLKRKRGLNESVDDFESPIKRIKTNNNKEGNNIADESAFPNLESTPTKKNSSPKKQRNVRSPSLALLEEEDELDDIISNNNNNEENEETGLDPDTESGIGSFKPEPEEHFNDAYETFHFDENILAVSLAEAPYCDIFIVTKTKLEFQRRVYVEEVCNQIQISKQQNVMVMATNKSSVVRIYNLSIGELIRSIVHPSAQALSLLTYQAKEEENSPSAAKRKFAKFMNMAQNYGANAVPSFTNIKVPQEFNPHEGCDPSGVRSIQLRGDRLAIANANQICMYSINDGFVLQTYKTLGALYPKVQLNNFEIGKIQFDDDIVIACYPLNDIVCLWTAKGGDLIKIKRHFTQDMKLAESRIVTLDSVRRSFSLWSWNYFYMYQVQHKIANSCCVDFNAFMVACGTVEGEVQLFDFEHRVNIPSQHSHKELSQYSIHTIQSITIQEKYRNVSFEELHYQHWLAQQHDNSNNNNTNVDKDREDNALELEEKQALTFENNNNTDDNNITNEKNTFDYDRLPETNLNNNEPVPVLFEYESDDTNQNDEKS
jgi:hypothetical protein